MRLAWRIFKCRCFLAALTTEAKMIETLVKEWLRTKAKEELLNIQRKEIEKKINQALSAGVTVDASILNLLQRVLKMTKKSGTRPEQTKGE